LLLPSTTLFRSPLACGQDDARPCRSVHRCSAGLPAGRRRRFRRRAPPRDPVGAAESRWPPPARSSLPAAGPRRSGAPPKGGPWTRERRPARRASDDVEVDVLVDRHRLERLLVERYVEDGLLLPGREATREVGPELGLEQRDAFLATPLVADRVFADDLVEHLAV